MTGGHWTLQPWQDAHLPPVSDVECGECLSAPVQHIHLSVVRVVLDELDVLSSEGQRLQHVPLQTGR